MRWAMAVVAAAMLAGCTGGFDTGSKYRPPVDYQMSVNHGVNYEGDLSACQSYANAIDPLEETLAMTLVGTGTGGALGSITGGVVNEITVLQGLGYGAAFGAVIGGVLGGANALQAQSVAVAQCMQNRGYVVLR